VHGHPGEQASEAPSVEILQWETDDNVFGEHLGATAHLRSSSSSLICILLFKLGNLHLHHGRQPWCCCGVGLFGRSLCSTHLLLVLVMVPFADLLDVLACLYMVKLVSTYLFLTSAIKLT
jgi:hypothetical protein